ncbi:MAG: hypothetical protein ABR922_25545 [Streptosporangiaceae bacterium]
MPSWPSAGKHSQNFRQYSSARVRGVGYETAIFAPNIGDPDVTNVWLAGN